MMQANKHQKGIIFIAINKSLENDYQLMLANQKSLFPEGVNRTSICKRSSLRAPCEKWTTQRSYLGRSLRTELQERRRKAFFYSLSFSFFSRTSIFRFLIVINYHCSDIEALIKRLIHSIYHPNYLIIRPLKFLLLNLVLRFGITEMSS